MSALSLPAKAPRDANQRWRRSASSAQHPKRWAAWGQGRDLGTPQNFRFFFRLKDLEQKKISWKVEFTTVGGGIDENRFFVRGYQLTIVWAGDIMLSPNSWSHPTSSLSGTSIEYLGKGQRSWDFDLDVIIPQITLPVLSFYMLKIVLDNGACIIGFCFRCRLVPRHNHGNTS